MSELVSEYIFPLFFNFSFSFIALDFAISKDATVLPKQVKYSLRLPHEVGGSQKRWRTENTYPNFQAVGPRKDEGLVVNSVAACSLTLILFCLLLYAMFNLKSILFTLRNKCENLWT